MFHYYRKETKPFKLIRIPRSLSEILSWIIEHRKKGGRKVKKLHILPFPAKLAAITTADVESAGVIGLNTARVRA